MKLGFQGHPLSMGVFDTGDKFPGYLIRWLWHMPLLLPVITSWRARESVERERHLPHLFWYSEATYGNRCRESIERLHDKHCCRISNNNAAGLKIFSLVFLFVVIRNRQFRTVINDKAIYTLHTK